MAEGGASPSDKARYGFRLCLARPPTDAELARLVVVYTQARERLAKQPDQAMKMATVPLGPVPPGTEPAEAAAWAVVGNVLLNLDEVFMSR